MRWHNDNGLAFGVVRLNIAMKSKLETFAFSLTLRIYFLKLM